MIPALEAVKALLWEEWDPIGVKGIDRNWPKDEYDAYAFEVWKMIQRSATPDEIEAYLADLETGHIGLSSNSGRAASVAAKAVAMGRGG